jgi:ribonuclease HII
VIRVHPGHEALIEFDKAKANGFRFFFGVDEAGRGPLAGPVVAAAVCLKDMAFVNRIGDSKVLSEAQRNRAFTEIHEKAFVGVGIVNEKVIDQINILNAAHLAMTQAVQDLWGHVQNSSYEFGTCPQNPVLVLIDGNSYKGNIPYKVECVVKGDAKSFSIACASIVAKVTRDRIMVEFDGQYPQYGFKAHSGYPTEVHRAAIKLHGLSPIHRKTFRVS